MGKYNFGGALTLSQVSPAADRKGLQLQGQSLLSLYEQSAPPSKMAALIPRSRFGL